jgi:hypothetical protein
VLGLLDAGRGACNDGAARQQDLQPGLRQGKRPTARRAACLLGLSFVAILLKASMLFTFCTASCSHLCCIPAPPQVGVCSALTGLCTCPAGFQDFNCMKARRKPAARLLCANACCLIMRAAINPLRGQCALQAGLPPSSPHTVQPLKRHCVHKWRTEGFERGPMPVNATETIGVENSAELTRSHCAGGGMPRLLLGWHLQLPAAAGHPAALLSLPVPPRVL